MSIDRNGRAHKPKGLPQHEAGTYDTNPTTMGDSDLQADGDPWATDPHTPVDPDMFDTTPPSPAHAQARRPRHATDIPEDAPAWDGPAITIRMIAEYAPIHIDPDDIQPDTIRIDHDHATLVILDRSDNLKHHRITMPTPAGLRPGDRLAWDGQHWRILKRGPQPRPAREPREQPTADGRAAVASRTTSGRRTPTRPADQRRTRRAADHDPGTIRRRRLANATLILLRGLAVAIRRGLRGR